MLFRLFYFVFETLASTVSACSEAGYGQICGQKPLPEIPGSGSIILACRDPSRWFGNSDRETAACGIPS